MVGELNEADLNRIADAVLQINVWVHEDRKKVPQITDELVDPNAVASAALARIKQLLQQMKVPPPEDKEILSILGAIWCDAFVIGLLFQKKGGHRAQ